MASNDDDKPREMTPTEQAIIDLLKRNATITDNAPKDQEEDESHAFWDTQPMPHPDTKDRPEGPIEPDVPKEELRAEPYSLPAGFEWATVDVTNDQNRADLYDLLAKNYVEDDDCLFRFDYSSDFLLWALTPPGYSTDLLLGVRSTKGKLLAFISGVPARVRIYEKETNVAEINFLCVHKKLRAKRLAPVLIKEITRRVNHTGTFQAVYTAGVVLPVPLSSSRYHHRSLNPKKLVDVGFSQLRKKMTMARMQKLYKLPPKPLLDNMRAMEPADVAEVHKLLTTYLSKFKLTIMFTPEEVAHWLLPREGVVNSYVLVNEENKPTDLVSFYHLPSTILNRDDTLFAAYSFYNVANTVSWQDLIKDSLIMARNGGADVFNALDLMDNEEFLQDLKFAYGDGFLQYYLYNWSCPPMKSNNVGIVLL